MSAPALHPAVVEAYGVLATGTPIELPLAIRLSELPGEDVLDLISLAHKVRLKYAPGLHACSIVNAKSGACPENCRFCAQSAHHAAQVPEYGLLDPAELLSRAEAVWRNGVRRFGIVTAGTGCTGSEGEVRSVIEAIGLIHERLPGMEVCASLGALDDAAAQALAAAGVSHYNLNLQVATGRYRELISDTHTAGDRLAALATLKRNGIGLCCGGIIGVGETMADRVALAFELRELGVETIPLNVLIPIPGTPLEGSAAGAGGRGREDLRALPADPPARRHQVRRGPRDGDEGLPGAADALRRQRPAHRRLPHDPGARDERRHGASGGTVPVRG